MAKNNGLTLRITGPDGAVNEAISEQDSIILGSGSGAGVRLQDPKVSNLHVMLKRESDGRVTAIDLGSEHGTRVGSNTVSIKDPIAITDGDILQLGGSQVRILFGAVAQAAKAVQAAVKQSTPAGASVINSAQVARKAGLSGTGRNAAALFNDALPEGSQPTESDKVLQVALLWGDTLINVQHYKDGQPVTIGEGKGTGFTVYGSDIGAAFNLAVAKGTQASIRLPPGANVAVAKKGQAARGREQLKSDGTLSGETLTLGLHDRAQISLDTVSFIIRFVRPSAALHVAALQDADYTFFKVISVALMAFLAMVLAMVLTPSIDDGMGDDIFANPAKYTRLLIKPEKKIELKKLEAAGIEEGAKAKDDEGKFGKKDEKKQEADPSKKGAPVVNKDKREEDRKKVMSAGLLGAMGGGASSNIFGPGGLGTGINTALGGLKGGAGVGDAAGVGGLGARGSGAGGGGTGLGLGGLGTKGGGRGAGGAGGLDLGGRGKEITRIIPGKTTAVGGLDKDVIARVIRRHQNEIKFCYEKELQKDQSLAGKVSVAWTIDPSGAVAEAMVQESTLSNPAVENCILTRVRRWKFPEEQNGSATQVNFPWVFQGAGSEE